MMKRTGIFFVVLWLLLTSGVTLAQTNAPAITSFGSTVTRLDRATVEARGGLVPVFWDTANRPANSNLVFEQLLPDGRVMNVELPRSNPIVPSAGNGVVFPFPPGAGVNEVRFRLTLVNLSNGNALAQRELIIPLGENASITPTITIFSTSATNVPRGALSQLTARIPVSFAVEGRPDNSNLVFEQVLDDNKIINVELPRSNPIVPSAGNGVVAPAAPTQLTTKSITLRLRLVNLGNNTTLGQKDITLPVTDEVVVGPTIRTFSTTATNVDGGALANKTARIPVAFAVDNRPNNSNLIFEQVLDDKSVVNVELPRQNPIVPSSGNGTVAPISPKNAATTSIMLRLRLVDLGTGSATLAEKTITLPIVTAVPTIRTFSTTATNVSLAALADKTARLPVAFAVDNRPPNSNLVFEQVLDDGSVVNVELPRQNPIVPSSGNGVVAPAAPKNAATNNITLRLRVVNLSNQSTLAQQSITVSITVPPPPTATAVPPPTPVPGSVVITTFSTPAQAVTRLGLVNNTARVPVVFAVQNRPANSNLVFEQALDNNTQVNIELPRNDPTIPSSGNGVVAPVAPTNSATTSVTLRLRVVNLTNNETYAQKDIVLPIIEGANAPTIRIFSTNAQNVDNTALTNRTARLPVTWDVLNRPANSNLVFEQVLENGSVVNVELPRQNPIVPSAGNGVVAPVVPQQNTTRSIALRLRLVDLGNNSTVTQSELSLPISGRPGMPEGVWEQIGNVGNACYSSGFPQGNGLIVGGRGQVNTNVPNGRIFVSTAVRSGLLVGEILAGQFFTVLEGPSCWKVSNGGTQAAYLRLWRVRSEAGNLEGWISEYEMDLSTGVARPYVASVGTSGGSTNTGNQPVVISSFTISPNPAARGGAVTISWNVTGSVSNVKVLRLSEFGATTLETIVDKQPASGSAPYTLSADYINSAMFQISVTGANGQESIQNASINLTCPFSNTLQDSPCPATQANSVETAFQPFEKGMMFWRGDTKKIYVFYNDSSWQEFADNWNGEANPSTDQPPQGLIKPEQGFGKIWYEIGGTGVLGWATAAETSYDARWETYPVTDAGQVMLAPVFTLPDNRVIIAGLIWQYQ